MRPEGETSAGIRQGGVSQISYHRSLITVSYHGLVSPISYHRSLITDLVSQISSHRSRITDLISLISYHRSRITDLVSQISYHRSRITGLVSPVESVKFLGILSSLLSMIEIRKLSSIVISNHLKDNRLSKTVSGQGRQDPARFCPEIVLSKQR